MTNAEIIFRQSLELVKAGAIGTTGRVLKFEDQDGTVTEVPEPEMIHTFAAWKELGYQVRKGEHAVAAFTIWKYTSKAKDEGEQEAQENGHCFLKKAFWFTRAQVDEIKAGA